MKSLYVALPHETYNPLRSFQKQPAQRPREKNSQYVYYYKKVKSARSTELSIYNVTFTCRPLGMGSNAEMK